MAIENLVKFIMRKTGRLADELHALLKIVYETASVRKPELRARTVHRRTDGETEEN